VAIRSFMDTDAKGQLGGIECSKDARERMAKDSGKWTCAGCSKSNLEIMKEREEAVKEVEETEGKRKEDEVPEELRLAYRDELAQDDGTKAEKVDKGKARVVELETQQEASASPVVAPPSAVAESVATSPPPFVPAIRPTRTTASPTTQQVIPRVPDRSLAWIDTCIWGVIAMLLFMVFRKF
jgi:ubiquitin-conjugating enzyme E2 J1